MDAKKAASTLVRYSKQPSTWQGISILAGVVAAAFGLPVEQATLVAGAAVSVVLILQDEAIEDDKA